MRTLGGSHHARELRRARGLARIGRPDRAPEVGVEGHRDEPAIKAALEKLASYAAYLKILGSYPVAVY